MKAIQALFPLLVVPPFTTALADDAFTAAATARAETVEQLEATILTDDRLDSITGAGTVITIQSASDYISSIERFIRPDLASRLDFAIGCSSPDLCILPADGVPTGDNTPPGNVVVPSQMKTLILAP